MSPKGIGLALLVALRTAGVQAAADTRLLPASALAAEPAAPLQATGSNPETERLRLRYGSRYLCETARDKAIGLWGIGGLVVGLAAGFYVDTLKTTDKYGYATSVTHGLGWEVGMLGGWGLGWLAGHAFAPDCSALPWTSEDIEKMERFRMAQKTYADCMQRRNRTIAGWTLGCELSAGVVGALTGLALGGSDSLSQLAGAILGGVAGSTVGYLAGDLIGRSKAEVCGDPPRPEEFMFSRPPAGAPALPLAPAGSSTVIP